MKGLLSLVKYRASAMPLPQFSVVFFFYRNGYFDTEFLFEQEICCVLHFFIAANDLAVFAATRVYDIRKTGTLSANLFRRTISRSCGAFLHAGSQDLIGNFNKNCPHPFKQIVGAITDRSV